MAVMIEKRINNYSLFIFEEKSQLSSYVSEFICNEICRILTVKERFQFCVCGGSTPRSVYNELSQKDLDWEKVDVFLGDERCVNPNSEESNTLMLKNSLFKDNAAPAFFYEIFNSNQINEVISKDLLISKLKEKCLGNPPSFDLTLLGLGDDGHTASLFPFKQNNSDNDLVIFSYGKGLKRISMTPKILSASTKIAFLVSGSSKKEALQRLVDPNESFDRTPAKLINSNQIISIFCDLEASKELLI